MTKSAERRILDVLTYVNTKDEHKYRAEVDGVPLPTLNSYYSSAEQPYQLEFGNSVEGLPDDDDSEAENRPVYVGANSAGGYEPYETPSLDAHYADRAARQSQASRGAKVTANRKAKAVEDDPRYLPVPTMDSMY